MARRPGRVLTEQEARLFRQAMHGVTPKAGQAAEPYTGPRSEGQVPPKRRTPSTLDAPKRTKTLPELDPGKTDGIDRRTAARFTKGRMDIDATLDLHGMDQDRAHRALIAFIQRARAAGYRCVLVITGKGSRSKAETGGPRGRGILKAAAPGWLNGPGVREHILSFSTARPRDGGDSAFYVLLKRVRGHR